MIAKRLRQLFIGGGVAVLLGSLTFTFMAPAVAYAEPSETDCNNTRFLTFPAWYRGVVNKDTCEVVAPTKTKGALAAFIWKIALNGVEILLQLVAYLTVGFIIYGGFIYLTSAGRSDKITRGREMIQNAVIGLIISLLAIALVAFVGGQIGVG